MVSAASQPPLSENFMVGSDISQPPYHQPKIGLKMNAEIPRVPNGLIKINQAQIVQPTISASCSLLLLMVICMVQA